MSSDILSRPVDVSKYGVIYAGAQKNMGIAGLGVVIIREDLVKPHPANIPVLSELDTMLEKDSMYNTPPCWAIYMLGLVVKWIDEQGGLEVMKEKNEKKAKLLYDYLDQSDFYKPHAKKDARSNMNVTFTTPSKELDAEFVKESIAAGMTNLKGHRSVSGIRASIYNAMPYEGVEYLVNFMKNSRRNIINMYKIKTLNKISEQGLEIFDDNYEVGDNLEHEDGILVRSAKLHDYDFPAELKAIARAGAGVNNIPVDTCTEKGICVFNTPGANANAVKELVLCALILSSRQVIPGIEWVKTLPADDFGKAVEKGKSQFVGPEIDGKKLGVIGLGAIGVNVANAAVKLGMEVYGYDPYISVNAAWKLSKWVHKAATVEELFKECDYITIHVPATPDTKNMINKKSLAMMKDGVRILNFARDTLVNTEDIIKALKSGKVARYITDFGSKELVETENTVVLPHLGASTPESEDNCATMAVKEMIDYLENGNIQNSVNLPTVVEPRTTTYRVCIIHKNIPNMLAVFANAFAKKSMNIENMVNKARGEYAYTVIDTNDLSEDITKVIENHEGVIKARIIAKIVF